MKARIQSGDAPLFPTGRPHGFGLRHHGPTGPNLDAAATYLGLTEAQLRTELGSGKTLAQIAKAHGKTAEGLVQALVDAAKKKLDAAVTAGRLTRAQGELDARGAEESHHRPRQRQRFLGDSASTAASTGPKLDAAATYLGMTEAQLRTELRSGKTLAQIAKAHGKTAEGLVQALVDAAEKKLDAAVKAGRLTRAEADEMLTGLKERITDFVNGRFPRRASASITACAGSTAARARSSGRRQALEVVSQ